MFERHAAVSRFCRCSVVHIHRALVRTHVWALDSIRLGWRATRCGGDGGCASRSRSARVRKQICQRPGGSGSPWISTVDAGSAVARAVRGRRGRRRCRWRCAPRRPRLRVAPRPGPDGGCWWVDSQRCGLVPDGASGCCAGWQASGSSCWQRLSWWGSGCWPASVGRSEGRSPWVRLPFLPPPGRPPSPRGPFRARGRSRSPPGRRCGMLPAVSLRSPPGLSSPGLPSASSRTTPSRPSGYAPVRCCGSRMAERHPTSGRARQQWPQLGTDRGIRLLRALHVVVTLLAFVLRGLVHQRMKAGSDRCAARSVGTRTAE